MAKINYPTYEPSYGYMTEKIQHAYVAMAIDKKSSIYGVSDA